MARLLLILLLSLIAVPITVFAVRFSKIYWADAQERCSTTPTGALQCPTAYSLAFWRQGRNTRAYGNDEASFVARAYQFDLELGSKHIVLRTIPDITDRLRAIHRVSVASNVNPLLLLALWGEEQHFELGGDKYAFGCGVYVNKAAFNGFYNNLACAVETLNNEMYTYEVLEQLYGTPVKLYDTRTGRQTCEFYDPLLYALERYGPVCTADDSNEHFHANLVFFYNKFFHIIPPGDI